MNNTELATYIRDHGGVTAGALSAHLGVSERTVRTYVCRLNDAMEPFAKVSKRRGGYVLECSDWNKFAEWLSGGTAKWASASGGLPTNSSERVAYIIDYLLSRNDWVTKDELAEMLYVSGNTVSRDLSVVEREFDRFGLSLERRPHYGIRATGDEVNRRLCLASAAAERLLKGTDVSGMDSREVFERVSRCVDEVVRRDCFSISTLAHRNLLVHLVVALMRIKEGCYVPTKKQGFEEITSSREYEVAQDIALELEKSFDVSLPPEEVAYIAIHLASKHMAPSPSDGRNGIVISDEVWTIVSEMLELVNASFHFDFRDNLELRMNLARHIVPLSYRLTYNMTLKNPLLDEVRSRYPLAWSMAVESSASLVSAYGRVPSDDEVGYIAMAFALALEREKTHAEGKSILIVCASGVGTAKLLEHLYERDFGQWLSSVQTCDAAHIDEVDLSGVDYVFTTVPLGRPLPVPVREVSAFLNESEVRDVRDLLSGTAELDSVVRCFDRELFFPCVPGTTRDEVLNWLCDRRIEYGGAGEGFRELVFKREAIVPTTYGNDVSMPHPLEPVSDRTVVCVGICDRSIDWGGGHGVRVVFLLSAARDHGPGRQFYDALATLMTSSEAIGRLVRCRDWETLMSLLGSATHEEQIKGNQRAGHQEGEGHG